MQGRGIWLYLLYKAEKGDETAKKLVRAWIIGIIAIILTLLITYLVCSILL